MRFLKNPINNITTAIGVLAIVFSCISLSPAIAQTPAPLEIRTLSSRPDLISGGDALVEVKLPEGVSLSQIKLTLNGKDVTNQLNDSGDTRSVRGVIGGMRVGENTLRAVVKPSSNTRVLAGRALQTSLKVTNYPITGPILSGPHLTPYECRTVESGLGQPLDSNCSAAQKVEYFYRDTNNTFKPLDPNKPRPADLVNTTNYDGKTVPYIVRVESGTINRSIYRIAILDDPRSAVASGVPSTDQSFIKPVSIEASRPAVASSEWRPGPGWNRKLAVSFGGGAGTQYNQGVNQATGALNDMYLSRGFAYIISTELVNQQHGNAVLQGETLMMLKEHFIERYGLPKWTVGSGGSGGAIQQLLITEIYPGLLDGLQPSASFPDSTMHTPDCGLLQNFWRKADPAIWTDPKKTAVEGYTKGTCAAWERTFVPVYTATNARGCALNDASKIYDPVKNPTGARCTVQDMRVNIYGRNPATGFARKPQDNIGLQYGLAALNSGAIGVDEFLDLNEQIGGNDIDGHFTSQRSVGDPIAIRAVYESGLMNSGGGGLANVPILHSRGYTDAAGDIHDRHRDLTIRARLQKANGRSDNQVIWVGPARRRDQPGGVDLTSLSVDTMNKWLDNLAADPAPLSPDKVVRNKPAEAVDAYWDADGKKLAETATFDGRSGFNTMYPVHSEPRLVAGAPLTNDVLKCQLKPINYAEYKVTFTVAQKARMAAIFPSGVCDFSKPGVEQVPLKGTYRRY
ncbi:MAG TPA: DUF6351 family protein [Blastocatellia bacterium]|nr:DUF6351 family protein [Blastocatellia bacterium]